MDARRKLARRPPRLAERLLRAAVPPGVRGLSIVGDLAEECAERRDRTSTAVIWYWRQALTISFRYIVVTRRPLIPRTSPMFDLSSDLKSAFRSLFKAPGTTTMITATLAAAIAATTVGFCFVD